MRSKQQLLTPALFIVALALFAPVADAQTDKATMVVNDMIAALGGKAFTNVREIQANGKFFTFKRDQMAGTEVFVDYIKFPDKERTEFGTYKIKPTNINNGDAGWSVYDKKVELQTPAEVKAFQTGVKTGFQFLARFVLNREGLTLQHVGTEMIDFKRNDVIEFRDSGNFFRLFVNQQSHLPTKMQVRRSGETFMREEQFANWHEFQGIQTALYTIHLSDGERTSEIRLEKVSYNPGMADNLFLPPIFPPAAR